MTLPRRRCGTIAFPGSLYTVGMSARPYMLAESNWREVQATRFEVALLPWGATEAHNFHLPYGTDTIQVEGIAAEAARLAWESGTKVIVLPAVPFGCQSGQMDIPLCVNMSPTTQLAVLTDIAASLAGQGITKLVLLNGHGGNEFKAIVRELSLRVKIAVCVVNWYQVVEAKGYFESPGDHAGELETSVTMHLRPDLVRPLSEAGDGAEKRLKAGGFREGWAWMPRHWRSASADTGIGDPRASSAAKGEACFRAVCAKLAAFVREFATDGGGYA